MRPSLFAAAFCACLAVAFGQEELRYQFEQLRHDIESKPTSSLAHYRLAEFLFLHKSNAEAVNQFREALNADKQPPWIVVWSHVNIARIFEKSGQRDRAENEYRLARDSIDNTWGGRDEAARAQARLASWPLPDDVYRLGTGFLSPELIEKTEPQYSDSALAAGLEGTVWIIAVVSEEGTIKDPKISKSLGLGLDQNALEATQHWRFRPGVFQNEPVAVLMTFPVDFRLPKNPSRWHLVGVEFHPPAGTSPPTVAHANFPTGPGIAPIAIEEGWLVAAMGRLATARVSFDIDEQGVPGTFQVAEASDPIWGNEAIAMLTAWRFEPGRKDGAPVTVGCSMDLVWGERKLRPTK